MNRGQRNKNPLNIRKSVDRFDGEIVPSQDKAFKQFESYQYGYRAAFVILATYNRRGWNTIEKIVSHWAPPTENHTKRYIDFVEKASGIPKDEILHMQGDKEKYIRVVLAMSRMEIGEAYPVDAETGFSMQKRLS